ncbi:hypothetical protein ABWH93_01115 [Seohaeicola saemankumensis]|uniref:hypothetical protein n=1 Tax=Seohaeicola TaxID=481178 RepID=UPI0035D0B84A
MGLDPSASRERLSCLQMFLQSAELRLIGSEARAELEVNCELSNVARGNCQVRLVPVDIMGRTTIGHVEIPSNRPIMRAEIAVSRTSFEIFLANLRPEPARPVALLIALETEIETNGHGDFLVPYPSRVGVLDLSWNFPLK